MCRRKYVQARLKAFRGSTREKCFGRLVDSVERPAEANVSIAVGGPDVLTFRQIAVLAAGATGVPQPRWA
jgi:hypothetical protein